MLWVVTLVRLVKQAKPIRPVLRESEVFKAPRGLTRASGYTWYNRPRRA